MAAQFPIRSRPSHFKRLPTSSSKIDAQRQQRKATHTQPGLRVECVCLFPALCCCVCLCVCVSFWPKPQAGRDTFNSNCTFRFFMFLHHLTAFSIDNQSSLASSIAQSHQTHTFESRLPSPSATLSISGQHPSRLGTYICSK